MYSSTPGDGKATLEVPSLNLKLNLNYIDETSCLSSQGKRLSSSSSKGGDQQQQTSKGRPKWDYAQNGSNWGKDYPECTRGQQSPINLLDAVSKYGQSYDIYKSATDVLQSTYGLVKQIAIQSDTDSQSIKLDLSSNKQYQGFTSQTGKSALSAPASFKASHIDFKYQSEHTVNDKRYDLEMQLMHTVDNGSRLREQNKKTPAPETNGGRRRLEEETTSSGGVGEKSHTDA